MHHQRANSGPESSVLKATQDILLNKRSKCFHDSHSKLKEQTNTITVPTVSLKSDMEGEGLPTVLQLALF